MDDLNEWKKEIIKKIKKVGYENKKLKQENSELQKKKKQVESDLIVSKSETAKAFAENQHLQKIISGNRKKIIEENIVETDEEMELPMFGHLEKISIIAERKKPKQ
jgi:hypothetical protein